FSVSGLHPNDPEYKLLRFMAGTGFSGAHDRPEVILTAALLGEVFDTSALEDASGSYEDFIGRTVTIVLNRYNTGRKLVAEEPVELRLVGIIANGEGGRQLYFPNTTLVLFDSIVRDREQKFSLPENAGINAWPDAEFIAEKTSYAWEDSLHVYAREIRDVMGLYTFLSRQGYKPESDIWDFKWALDIQDTAWRVFVPLLGLIVVAVFATVAANIFTSAKLRETELALWRVLGMRRGDLVLTQIISITVSVSIGAVAGLAIGGLLIRQTKAMLVNRSLETAAATGGDVQNFDAIFAPVSSFATLIIVGSISVGILAAIWPAIRTAKTDPAKVLRS
ncbi:MAG TPA: FtsX-like permease family protein, partial [Aliiroseovarius sp.]|nr:FtsX-like permease family protein [Aliiroseovarius sp.]